MQAQAQEFISSTLFLPPKKNPLFIVRMHNFLSCHSADKTQFVWNGQFNCGLGIKSVLILPDFLVVAAQNVEVTLEVMYHATAKS